MKDGDPDMPMEDGRSSIERLFALDAGTYQEGQSLYRGRTQQEYYLGDFWIGDERPVWSFRKRVGAVSIINQISRTDLFFRRNWRHIRTDALDIAILWFVRRGTLSISTPGGEIVAGPGDLAVTRSSSPLFVRCRIDDHQVHKVLHVAIPAHALRSYLPVETTETIVIPRDRPELRFAEKIFGDVFSEIGLSADAVQLLVDTAFRLIAMTPEIAGLPCRRRRTTAETRFEEICRVVQVQLSNPSLSPSLVAESCGISVRNLSAILRRGETTFSKSMWGTRLDVARKWLANSDPREISVAEVSYGLGFKSPAHFSRSFKRRFGANPRDVRLIAD